MYRSDLVRFRVGFSNHAFQPSWVRFYWIAIVPIRRDWLDECIYGAVLLQ
jgi:hypothetical protein